MNCRMFPAAAHLTDWNQRNPKVSTHSVAFVQLKQEPLNYEFYVFTLTTHSGYSVGQCLHMVYTSSSKRNMPAAEWVTQKQPQTRMKSPDCLPRLLLATAATDKHLFCSSVCCKCSQLLKHVPISVRRLKHKELFEAARNRTLVQTAGLWGASRGWNGLVGTGFGSSASGFGRGKKKHHVFTTKKKKKRKKPKPYSLLFILQFTHWLLLLNQSSCYIKVSLVLQNETKQWWFLSQNVTAAAEVYIAAPCWGYSWKLSRKASSELW